MFFRYFCMPFLCFCFSFSVFCSPPSSPRELLDKAEDLIKKEKDFAEAQFYLNLAGRKIQPFARLKRVVIRKPSLELDGTEQIGKSEAALSKFYIEAMRRLLFDLRAKLAKKEEEGSAVS